MLLEYLASLVAHSHEALHHATKTQSEVWFGKLISLCLASISPSFSVSLNTDLVHTLTHILILIYSLLPLSPSLSY